MAMSPSNPVAKRLCLGIVTGPHGVRGAVRIKSFTEDPAAIGAYGPLSDEAGTRRFALTVQGLSKGVVLAELAGVADRDAAEALRGLHLYIERERLPPADADEFYHADLIGLDVVLASGDSLGRVAGLYDFGAGQSLEITGLSGETIMVPFTKAVVPVVDLVAGRLVVEPPDGLFDKMAPPAPIEQQESVAAELLAEAGE
jgi:16S rRNA processing protein RimM